jgi:hypothetical protein
MSQQPSSEQDEAPRTPEQHNRPSASSLFFSFPTGNDDNDSRNNAILGSSAPAATSMLFRSVDSGLPLLHRRRQVSQQQEQQQHEQQQPHEQDLCDFSVTPMTSRPHNCSFYVAAPTTRTSTSTTTAGLPTIHHRRVRSRSLGHVLDLEESVAAALFLRQEPPSSVQQPHTVSSTTTTDYFTAMKRHYTPQQQQQPQQQGSALSHLQETYTTTNKNWNDGGDHVLGLVTDQLQQLPIDDRHHYHHSKSMTALDDDVPNGVENSTTSVLLSKPSTSATHDHDHQPHPHNIRLCILYGMINATIILPVLMSFTSIIYRDNAFGPYMNGLTKLTIVSGIVHQLCFSTFSTLPFAVGQGRRKNESCDARKN